MSTKIKKDDNYMNIVGNILDNEEFNQIKGIEHHGTTRFEHSVRVSYYSYKISKLLHLDYVETARAGLLHDLLVMKIEMLKIVLFLLLFILKKLLIIRCVFLVLMKRKRIL